MINDFCNTKVIQYDLYLTYAYILCGLFILYSTFKKLFNSKQQFNLDEEFDLKQSLDEDFNSNNLNTRMKLYEDYTEHYVSKVGEEPFVVRLKGRNFKNIKANEKYKSSMELLGRELMREFHAHTAMVFNDEIVLIFSASQYHQFNGRCVKLQSIIASYASSSLTFKTNELCSFYCSVIDFKSKTDELIYYIKWRVHQALSLKLVPVFIKRQIIDDTQPLQYKHVKFMLKNIRVDDTFINLFTAPNFEPEDYSIKFRKIYDL
jgi:hypothetical protein